ncbi:unnamed protein product [Linum tenue]|uniref:Uncharacterized protein n=1 Tax=Linum tenue TaxID=586396 RepID=A0AAV0PVH4_9ROSI|nr:unnamed protein product [Linum tenue]
MILGEAFSFYGVRSMACFWSRALLCSPSFATHPDFGISPPDSSPSASAPRN